MIEVPTKEDYESLAKKHNELVELVKSTSSALGKMQEELDQMPSGYRNAQDIKNLKSRIEKLEMLLHDSYGLNDRMTKMEECCKNTVASGKALEERVNNHKKLINEIQDTQVGILRNGLSKSSIKEIVLDTLRSL